jgi:putative ABC transport system permease protein
MNFGEALRTSLTEILSHKLRSLLTLVGVILGTTSLVVMVSVIGGAADGIQKGLSDLGFDGVMFVTAQPPKELLERRKQGYSRGLRTADLTVIRSGAALVSGAAPVVGLTENARMNGRDLRVELQGITPEFGLIRNRKVGSGRYIVEHDQETVSPVAVLGSKLKGDAFGTEEALGREILIRGVRFRVVGVLSPLGSDQVDDDEMIKDNSRVYVPLSTLQKYFTGTDVVDAYAFKVRDPKTLTDAQKEAEALLRRSHHGISDFRVENVGEEIVKVRSEIDKLVANWRIVLASIAGISLLVGGIGIFSVMQISISERFYEIGLRKSLGATDTSIFVQFLIESVSLSVVGGLSGSALGSGITLAAGQAFPDGLSISPVALLLAALFAVLIGLAAGLYPALRASRLSPVEAIRAL